MNDLLRRSMPEAEIKPLLESALQICTVQPGSPAEALGIRAGWEILRLNGEIPELDQLNIARRTGMRSMMLYDPPSDRAIEIGESAFPLGMKLIPKINEKFVAKFQKGRVTFQELHRLWNLGNWTHFAHLHDAFENALLPAHMRLFGRLFPNHLLWKNILAASDWGTQQFLALSLLAKGDGERALALIMQAEKTRQSGHQAAVPTPYLALNCFIESLAAYQKGDKQLAAEIAEDGAYAYGAECNGLLRLFGEMSGKGQMVSVSERLGKPFPVDYTLEQNDPLRIWPAKSSHSLKHALANTQEGQICLVYTLNGYRTNGPFHEEIDSLIALYRHDPKRISEIHVVTSQPGAPASAMQWAPIEQQAFECGLPIRVLIDPKNKVVEMLGQDSFPGLHILDKNGVVVGTELCAEEDGYWLSLARLG